MAALISQSHQELLDKIRGYQNKGKLVLLKLATRDEVPVEETGDLNQDLLKLHNRLNSAI